MPYLVPQFPELTLRDYFGVFDDFAHYVTADDFTTVATDSGTIADGDYTGGAVAIAASDATEVDNDETYLKGTQEIYKFAADKPLVFEARVKPVANTIGNANFIVGIKDAVAANTLVDDGAGPASSYGGAVFFAIDGDTTWWCESSIAGTQTTVDSGVTVTNNTYTTLRIEYRPISSTVGEVHYFIDGVEKGKETSGENFKAQTVTFASATDMQICLGTKDGANNNGATLYVDYVGCWQKR